MNLDAVRHEGAGAFLRRAEQWLLRAEDRNNLILSLAYARARRSAFEPDAFFGTVEDGGQVIGCALRTPPHKLLVTDMPDDAALVLVPAVASVYDTIGAVLGSPRVAQTIADAWVGLRGGRSRPGMRQGVYRVDEVQRARPTAGSPREARPSDADVVADWGRRFARDTGEHGLVRPEVSARWIGEGKLFLWEEGGRPVSMTAARGRTPRGVRVGYVYTPPEFRGHGYASALVAHVSQRMLDDGVRFCILFTDLSNPTSNAIYQALGYRPICELRDIEIFPRDVQ